MTHEKLPSVLTAQPKVCSVKDLALLSLHKWRPSIHPHLSTVSTQQSPSRHASSAGYLLVPCPSWDHGSPDLQDGK